MLITNGDKLFTELLSSLLEQVVIQRREVCLLLLTFFTFGDWLTLENLIDGARNLYY
jgi:hypothetical protein